jgi:CRISPR/Cas system Type II protein with McrA/HNH and RuvC-like nuclease domain
MKDQILKLRSEGKSFKQIAKILGCAKSTVSYHCGEGQKEKSMDRQNKRRREIVNSKLTSFKNRFRHRTRDFQRREENNKLGKANYDFTREDVLNKFGVDTKCYLSGTPINMLRSNDYAFDHVIPVSKGGLNTLENLGITTKLVNRIKTDQTPEELFFWCKKILEYNGYKVTKKMED